MKTAPRFLLIALLTLFFAACSSGGDDNQPPDLVDKPSVYENDPFTMFLLPDTKDVKGVLFFLTGGNGDGRPWVRGQLTNDPEATMGRQRIVQLMQTYNLAFMGNDNSHYSDTSPHQTMISALEEFAIASDHPELAQAPLLPFGYSDGGRAALNFAFNYPGRTLGVYSYKGTIYQFPDQSWGTIRSVPTFLHMGELDTNVGNTIPQQFGPNREAGANWGAGIEKGVTHDFNPPMAFITTWMKGLVVARIPNGNTDGTIPVLKALAEESGWLGDLNTFEIMPYAEFQGDPALASWLYNEETSQEWQSVFE